MADQFTARLDSGPAPGPSRLILSAMQVLPPRPSPMTNGRLNGEPAFGRSWSQLVAVGRSWSQLVGRKNAARY